jgi:hypothetical protein
MPTTSGIIDDYNTVAKRKAAAEAAALKRIARLICIEADNRTLEADNHTPEPVPVIEYRTAPTPAENDKASADRVRRTVHAIVDRMLGLK